MYICIYVDSLVVALIFKVWFFKARFFRRGWIVLVLGCFGPPRISKDFERFRRISKDFERVFEGFSMDFDGFQRISMDFEGLGL